MDLFEFVGTAAISQDFRGKVCITRPIPEGVYKNVNHITHTFAEFEGARKWWIVRKADLVPYNPNKPVI